MPLLESPRRRRRLAAAAAVLALGTPLVYLAVHFSTPGSAENANGPFVKDSGVYRQPKHVPFTARERRDVKNVLARFIATAVARRHVAESWKLAGPALRTGLTRKEWSTGDIPVVPYPVAERGQGTWNVVQYSYRNEVGLEALLFPRRGSGYSVATVDTTMVRGRDGRWRVNYWMLTKFHGPGSTAPADSASAFSEGPPNVHKLPGHHAKHKARAATHESTAAPGLTAHPDRTWLLLPLGLLLLAVALPIVIGTVVWIRNRRAAAQFRRA